MRFIFDNNQFGSLLEQPTDSPANALSRRILIAPYPFAESLFSSHHRVRSFVLNHLPLIGMFPDEYYDKMRGLPFAEATATEPVVGMGLDYIRIRGLIRNATPSERRQFTEKTKQRFRDHCESVSRKLRGISKGTPTRFRTLDSFIEGNHEYELNHFRDRVFQLFDSRTGHSARQLYGKSPHVRRDIRMNFAMYLSWARLWAEDVLNIEATANRDDMTDLSLAMYARDGDRIVTADNKLIRLIGKIEEGLPVENVVLAQSWCECLSEIGAGAHAA